jgi:hypothetical protein
VTRLAISEKMERGMGICSKKPTSKLQDFKKAEE